MSDLKTTIQNTAQAVMQTAMKKAVELAPDSWVPGGKPDPLTTHKHGLIGASVSRIDGPLKVQGAARFAAEFPLDGMLYAALAYSTIAKGRITALDTAEAEAAPGVALVMTHLNAPPLKPQPVFMTAEKAAGSDSLPILDAEIHWNGQPIALVLAETQEQADHAKSLIRVAYAPEDGVTALEVAKAAGATPAVFAGQPLKFESGDPDAGLADAPHKVDNVYRTPRHSHNAIEPHACTLQWVDGVLHVHDSTQMVAHHAWTMAQSLGVEEEQVHISSPYVGGGFGSKGLWRHQILAAAASRVVGRPVRLTLSREGVYRIVGGRTLTEQRLALAADEEGRFTSLIHTGVVAMTPHNAMPEPFILPTMSAYASPAIRLSVETVKLNMMANTFMRAPGEAVGTFALESAVDELAHEMGLDPVELRIRNEPEKDPVTGRPFSSRNIVDAWRSGAERFGWSDRNPVPGARREGEWLVGVGCATSTYPYHRMPGGKARLSLARDGRVSLETAAHEMGMGTSTTHAMVVAERMGVEMGQVTVAYGDSRLPGMIMAGGSQQTASIGAAVAVAHRELVGELLKLAGNDSPLAGLKPDEVGGLNGGLASLENPELWESYGSILDRAQRDTVSVEGAAPPPMETMHWSMHSHGAMFCEVRVNAVTGETRVSRFLGSFDCGRILNAKTATSQFRGGIIMGLGLALMEETEFDERNGRIMNPSLAEYHVPVHMDVPHIEVMWTDIPDPHAPMGARGIGEIGITGVGAAVANAVFNATGKRIRDLPITLDKLM